MNLIEQALQEHWGPKCSEYEEGCIVCDAWREYENLATYGETLKKVERVDNNMLIEELLRQPVDVAIRKAVGKLIKEKDICTITGKNLNAS
jgi:hypothetical protein